MSLSPLASVSDVFRREGEYWSIAFETDVFRLKDVKGLRYIARLLEEPSDFSTHSPVFTGFEHLFGLLLRLLIGRS